MDNFTMERKLQLEAAIISDGALLKSSIGPEDPW